MNILHRVTLNALKKNRTRTAVTIIGVILSAAMICAVTSFAASLRDYMYRVGLYESGDWYGRLDQMTVDDFSRLEQDPRTETLFYQEWVGYARIPSQNDYKPYLFVSGGDEAFFRSMPVHLTAGRLPQNGDEILLPLHLASNGGVRYQIGDVLTLSIGDRRIDRELLTQNNPLIVEDDETAEELVVRTTRRFQVVGFYERPDFEPYSAPGYTALTFTAAPSADALYSVYFKTANPADVYDYIHDYHFGGASSNSSVLMTLGVAEAGNFYTVLYGLCAIVLVLITIGSVSLIYNAFSISVSERTRQFGLLSSLGATRRQLRGSVLFEALFVAGIGIPIGVICGIGGIGVTLFALSDVLSLIAEKAVPVRLCVSLPSVALAVALALLTVLLSAWIPSRRAMKVSAIDAIRQSRDVSTEKGRQLRASGPMYRLFGLEGLLARKYFRRSRKKYRTTVLSLFMSVVLFISAGALGRYLSGAVEDVYDTASYDLLYSRDLESGEAARLYEVLSSARGVTGSGWYVTSRLVVDLPEEYVHEDYKQIVRMLEEGQTGAYNRSFHRGSLRLNVALFFLEEEAYTQWLTEQHMDPVSFLSATDPTPILLDRSRLYTTADGGRFSFYRTLADGIPSLESQNYRYMEGYTREETEEDAVVYVSDADGSEVRLTPREARISLDLSDAVFMEDGPFFVDRENICLLYPMSAMQAILGGPIPGVMEVKMGFLSSDYRLTEADMATLLAEEALSSAGLSNVALAEEQERGVVTVINVFSYGFIILISLIAVANVFNTVSTNIALRRRDFAMLRSVGLTGRGFRKMLGFECLMYGLKALLPALPVSAAMTYLIYLVVDQGITVPFTLPWGAVAVACVSVFFVVAASMVYAMKKLRGEDPADALKNENL